MNKNTDMTQSPASALETTLVTTVTFQNTLSNALATRHNTTVTILQSPNNHKTTKQSHRNTIVTSGVVVPNTRIQRIAYFLPRAVCM